MLSKFFKYKTIVHLWIVNYLSGVEIMMNNLLQITRFRYCEIDYCFVLVHVQSTDGAFWVNGQQQENI